VLRPNGAPNPATTPTAAALSPNTGMNPPSTSDASWRNPRTNGSGSAAALLAPPLLRVSFTQGPSAGNYNHGGNSGIGGEDDDNFDSIGGGDGDIDMDGTSGGGGESIGGKSDGALGAVGPGGAGPLQCVARVFAAAEAAAAAATAVAALPRGGSSAAPRVEGEGHHVYDGSTRSSSMNNTTNTTGESIAGSSSSSTHPMLPPPTHQQPVSKLGLSLRAMGKRPGLPGVRYSALEVITIMIMVVVGGNLLKTGLLVLAAILWWLFTFRCCFAAMLLSVLHCISILILLSLRKFFFILYPTTIASMSTLIFCRIFSALPGPHRRCCQLFPLHLLPAAVAVFSCAVLSACC